MREGVLLILKRGLEHNRSSAALWPLYLHLYVQQPGAGSSAGACRSVAPCIALAAALLASAAAAAGCSRRARRSSRHRCPACRLATLGRINLHPTTRS